MAARTPVFVSVSALNGGHLTLPEPLFVTEADPSKRTTVPSLCFLVQHPSPLPAGPAGSSVTRLVFDLGVKRDLDGYTPAQKAHTAQRQPVVTHPDCAASLRDSNLAEKRLDPSKDIDYVILSHVHWDHVGTPADFARATFVVGSGTLDVLRHGAGPLYPAELFNHDELPAERTVELPPVGGTPSNGPRHTETPVNSKANLPASTAAWEWKPLGGFPAALDFFGDGSLYVVDSPGHLYGHVNLLARLGEHRYVYLGGDCCHDPRILAGEKGIAMYEDGRGGMRSVHVDTGTAQTTLDRIRAFLAESRVGDRDVDVEVVVAHDAVWRESNRHRFWPNMM